MIFSPSRLPPSAPPAQPLPMTTLRRRVLRRVLVLLAACIPASATGQEIFAVGADRAMWHRDAAGTWRSLGGQFPTGASPDACAWGNGQVSVFSRGADDRVWVNTRTSAWQGWAPIDGLQITSDPGVACGGESMEVFARGPDGVLWEIGYAGGWGRWVQLEGSLPAGASPDVARTSQGDVVVVMRDAEGGIALRQRFGDRWMPWQRKVGPTGARVTSDPTVTRWGEAAVVHVRGADGAIWRTYFERTPFNEMVWGAWTSLGGEFPLGASPDASGEVVVARGTDDEVWAWNGGQWQPLGGEIRAGPAVLVPAGSLGAAGVERGPAARYRVIATGFIVDHATYDGLEWGGKGDEVVVHAAIGVANRAGEVLETRSVQSIVIGDVNHPDWQRGPQARQQAGSRSSLGGLQDGDPFPSREPWRRTREPGARTLPMLLWEGTLSDDAVLFVVPSIWEWDAASPAIGFPLNPSWTRDVDRVLAHPGFLPHYRSDDEPELTWQSSPENLNRPIGVSAAGSPRRDGASFYASGNMYRFSRRGIEELIARGTGPGPGIVEVRMQDFRNGTNAEYRLFLQLERVP